MHECNAACLQRPWSALFLRLESESFYESDCKRPVAKILSKNVFGILLAQFCWIGLSQNHCLKFSGVPGSHCNFIVRFTIDLIDRLVDIYFMLRHVTVS